MKREGRVGRKEKFRQTQSAHPGFRKGERLKEMGLGVSRGRGRRDTEKGDSGRSERALGEARARGGELSGFFD